MFGGNSLTRLNLRLGSKNGARRPRRSSAARFASHEWMLEERLLLSRGDVVGGTLADPVQTQIYVADNGGAPSIGPYTLQHPAQNAGGVMFLGGTSPSTPGKDWGTVPTKSVTFTNNSSTHQTIYPFLYSPNNNITYDPIDTFKDEYRLYVGFQKDGKFILGLPYGDTITISVPLVFWNGGRADIATDGANLIPQPANVDTVNPYQFRYTASTYITTDGVTSSNDNGVLMYYKQNNPGAPNDPSSAAPGQLTEWTIRDKDFLTQISAYNVSKSRDPIPASELVTLVNYDVSYVDDMTAPVAMAAQKVPVPIQYIQNGTATSPSQTTTTIALSGDTTSILRLLTQLYPYATNDWQVKYNNTVSKTTIEMGKVTNVSGNTLTVVSSGPVSGIPRGVATFVFYTNSVTQDFGWTGANNDIGQMQQGIKNYTGNDPATNGLGLYFTDQNGQSLGWPEYYNPDPNAPIKIPSGASILINSPLTTKTSPFDIHYYLLTSGNNGKRVFYDVHEDLSPQQQPLNSGAVVTFKVDLSTADLAAIKSQGGSWVLNIGLNTAGAALIGTIDVSSINPAQQTLSVKLARTIDYNRSGYSFNIVAPPTDPYSTKITNLWYSWADYYVKQFSGTVPDVTGKVTADTDSPADTRIVTLATARDDLAVGMSLTGSGITGLTTILRIATVKGQQTLYLSAPVLVVAGQNATFQVANPAAIAHSTDKGVDTTLLNGVNFGADADFAKKFAGTVYELMSNYSTIPDKHTDLPPAMDLVYEAIGGNVGFLPPNVKIYTQITADVRDLGKSALRGVPNFLTYPEQHQTDAQWQPGAWYPPPSKNMYSTGYNIYNLDPFVWFVHQGLDMSGYGFSFDDDVSDVGAGGASALTITYASGPAANPITSQWFPSTPWGKITVLATITPATDNSGKMILTIVPQDTKQSWQVFADDDKNGLVGAYVSTSAAGILIPVGTRLSAKLDSNALTFVLSDSNVTQTTTPVSITLTGYVPK